MGDQVSAPLPGVKPSAANESTISWADSKGTKTLTSTSMVPLGSA